jgi:hypothetical protein
MSQYQSQQDKANESKRHPKVESSKQVYLKRVHPVRKHDHQRNRCAAPPFTTSQRAMDQEQDCNATGDERAPKGMKQAHKQARNRWRKRTHGLPQGP